MWPTWAQSGFLKLCPQVNALQWDTIGGTGGHLEEDYFVIQDFMAVEAICCDFPAQLSGKENQTGVVASFSVVEDI